MVKLNRIVFPDTDALTKNKFIRVNSLLQLVKKISLGSYTLSQHIKY